MADKQGRFVILDTTLAKPDATLIDELSGRQGDNGRVVYFALKDGQFPHNLDGQDVTLQVKDSAGKIKIVNGIYDMISATAGLFSMYIPKEVYQAAGNVQEAYLAVVDNNGVNITSIPIAFTVFENGIIISANASQDYLSSVDKMIAKVKKKFDEYVDAVKQNIDDVADIHQQIENIFKQLASQSIVTTTSSDADITEVLVSLTVKQPDESLVFEKVSDVDDIEERDYISQIGGVTVG